MLHKLTKSILHALLVLQTIGSTIAFSSSKRSLTMSTSNISTKRVLVTGGNKGIGYAICKKLLEDHPDVYVILGSRDKSRGEAAIQSLQSSVTDASDRLELVELDTCSNDSIKKALESTGLNSNSKQLYGIVNNAGIGFGRGFKDTIETNFKGTKQVCDIFGPCLMRPYGRIVNIASASGPNFISRCQDKGLADKLANPILFQESEGVDGISTLSELADSYLKLTDYGDDAYGLSKAFVNAYTVLYAKANPDLIVNSCSPGYILTGK